MNRTIIITNIYIGNTRYKEKESKVVSPSVKQRNTIIQKFGVSKIF